MTVTPTEPVPPTPPVPAQEPPTPPKVDETDWKAEARKHEARAKEYKIAADKLAAIEEANKTEAQKSADRLAVAEKDAVDARRDALKFRIAAKFAIGDEAADALLTGNDEATMTRQAELYTARQGDLKKQGNRVPREGGTPPQPSDDPMREFTQRLFAPGE
jgi:hypothetical protein